MKIFILSISFAGNTLNSDVELFIEAKSEKVNKKKRNLNCGEKLNNDCNSDDNEVRNNVQSSDVSNKHFNLNMDYFYLALRLVSFLFSHLFIEFLYLKPTKSI